MLSRIIFAVVAVAAVAIWPRSRMSAAVALGAGLLSALVAGWGVAADMVRATGPMLAFLTYDEEHSAGWTILHRESLAQGGPLAAELSELRERVARMLTTLFNDEAFAHAFAGAGESLADWWLAHPGQPKEQIAKLLMDIAQSAPAPPAGRA